MRAITALTTAYIVAIAIAFSTFIGSSGSMIGNVAFAEAAFAVPMMIAYLLALVFRSVPSRHVLLSFEIGYAILSLAVLADTFIAEHDAQYQLAVLIIPLIGFPAVVIAGVIAALAPKVQPD